MAAAKAAARKFLAVLVVARGDTTEVLQLVEEAFDRFRWR
jgi:hypothetical protein